MGAAAAQGLSPSMWGVGGAVASGLGGIATALGNRKNEKAKRKAYEAAMKDVATSKRQAQQGFTDDQGNTVKFIDGQGWVVTTKDRDKQYLADRTEKQEMEAASEVMNKYRNTRDLSQDDIFNIMYEAARGGSDRSVDEQMNTAMRQMNRTGANTGAAMQSAGRAKQKAAADAYTNAKMQSRLGGSQINADKKNAILNEYFPLKQAHAQRASALGAQMPALASNLSNINSQLSGMIAQQPTKTSNLNTFGSIMQGLGGAAGAYGASVDNTNAANSYLDQMKQQTNAMKKLRG